MENHMTLIKKHTITIPSTKPQLDLMSVSFSLYTDGNEYEFYIVGKRLYSETRIFSVKVPIGQLVELFINHNDAIERTIEVTEGVILSKKITLSQLLGGDWSFSVYMWNVIPTLIQRDPYILVFFGTISKEKFEEITLFIKEVIKLYFEDENNAPVKNEPTEIEEKVENTEGKEVPDMVNHPPHYMQCSFECIDVMKALASSEQFFGYCALNALKYLWRFKFKNKKEDVNKAHWYLEKLKECPASLHTENIPITSFLNNLYNTAIGTFEKEDEERN